MESEIQQIRQNLDEVCEFLHTVHDDLVFVSSPNFDPLGYPLEDVTGYETPEDVVEIRNQLEDDRAQVDMELIRNNLSILQGAVALIEAQIVLQKKAGPSLKEDIKTCVLSDEHAFIGLFDEAISLSAANSRSLGKSVEPASVAKIISDVNEDYARISKGELSEKLEGMDVPALQEKIFDLRCHFAELSIEKAHLQLAGIYTDTSYIKYMKRFVDEGIVQDRERIDVNIREAFRRSADMLPNSEAGLSSIKRFMGGLYEMGDDNYGTGAFKVERYHPVSIRTVRFF